MRRVGLLWLGLLCLCAASPAAARDVVYHLPIAQALQSPDAAKLGNFKFVFADEPATGYTKIREYLADERSHFHGRTEEMACQANFLDALNDLRKKSQDEGGDAAIGIVSYYREVTFSSTTQYECHAGSNGVFVWLKGVLVKSQ